MPTLTGICLHSVTVDNLKHVCGYINAYIERVLSVVHNKGERDRGFKYLP